MKHEGDAAVRDWITNEIAVRRRAVMTVMDTMPYAYTVGNSQHGLPELIVFGMADAPMARGFLNLVSIAMRAMKGKVDDGQLITPGKQGKVKVIDADLTKAAAYTTWLQSFFPPIWTPRLMQVLLADQMGKFPPKCADPYSRVPILKKAAVTPL